MALENNFLHTLAENFLKQNTVVAWFFGPLKTFNMGWASGDRQVLELVRHCMRPMKIATALLVPFICEVGKSLNIVIQ